MRNYLLSTGAGLASAVLLGGCASVPRDAGFPKVQQAVMDRTGHSVQWNQGTESDRQAADAVHAMLQRELTADDAVQVALLNNQNLQATYEELGIAQAELVEMGLLKNPSFTADVRFPKARALPFEIEVTQSFIDLLLMPLRKRTASAAFEAAKLRVTQEVLGTAANVKVAYYRAQGSAQLVEMRGSIVAATDASFDAARRMHEAGNSNDLALANERALHEQAKIDLARAEREALDSREELSALMGVWGADTAWTVAPRLPSIPPVEIDATHLESLAITNRADLLAAWEQVEVYAGSLGLTRSMPFGSDVTIGGHFSQESDATKSAGPTISLPLPIFNQGQPAIFAAQARLRQAQRRYAALAVQIRSDVRRARNNLLAARDLADYYGRVIVPLRHQIVQENMLQLNAMRIGVFELLQSKQAEIDAGREYVEALKGYWVAHAELERAVGGRLPASRPSTQPTAATSPNAPMPGDAASPATPPHHHGE